MYYAGIGSRTTPVEIQHLMYQIAKSLARQGYTLRSGAASGADQHLKRVVIRYVAKRRYTFPGPLLKALAHH